VKKTEELDLIKETEKTEIEVEMKLNRIIMVKRKERVKKSILNKRKKLHH